MDLVEERERERDRKAFPFSRLAMAPAGKVSGFRREGNDWYSFMQIPLLICFGFIIFCLNFSV